MKIIFLSIVLMSNYCTSQCASANNLPSSIKGIVNSSGKDQIDNLVANCVSDLITEVGIDVSAYFYNDSSSPNAQAVGTNAIYIGLAFAKHAMEKDPSGTGLEFVIAHEIAHNYQLENPKENSFLNEYNVIHQELQADLIAGFLMKKISRISASNLNAMIDKCIDIGDYSFKDSSHHGTAFERANAARMGYDYASEGEDIDTTYSESYKHIVPADAPPDNTAIYTCNFDNGTILYILSRGKICKLQGQNFSQVGQMTSGSHQKNQYYIATLDLRHGKYAYVDERYDIYSDTGYKIGKMIKN